MSVCEKGLVSNNVFDQVVNEFYLWKYIESINSFSADIKFYISLNLSCKV